MAGMECTREQKKIVATALPCLASMQSCSNIHDPLACAENAMQKCQNPKRLLSIIVKLYRLEYGDVYAIFTSLFHPLNHLIQR